MYCKLSDNKKYIEILEATQKEVELIVSSFVLKDPKFHYKKRYTKSNWDGFVRFIYNDRYIPVGLYSYLYDKCQLVNVNLEVDEGLRELLLPKKINYDEFQKFARNLLDGIEFPGGNKYQYREYQYTSAYEVLRHKKCIAEIATSSGKTIIFFKILSYLRNVENKKKFLVIVPSISLVDQFIDDFEIYNQKELVDWVPQPIYGGTREGVGKRANLVVGTYQSLVKKDKEFFDEFDVVAIDEVDSSKCRSIQDILKQCMHCDYRFGMTGTLPKENTIERLQVMSVTGPLIYTLTSEELINKGDATPCEVWGLRLKYLDKESEAKLMGLRGSMDGKDILTLENEIVKTSKNRLNWITNFSSNFDKNSLILFHHVDYGKSIYTELRNSISDKEIYYIDGSVKQKDRDEIISRMKDGDGKILVASFGTLAVGISIPNLHYIMFTQSFKSDKVIRQSIGRGLRKKEGKSRVIIIDVVDDFSTGFGGKNILLRHFEERKRIYEEQGFPYIEKTIEL